MFLHGGGWISPKPDVLQNVLKNRDWKGDSSAYRRDGKLGRIELDQGLEIRKKSALKPSMERNLRSRTEVIKLSSIQLVTRVYCLIGSRIGAGNEARTRDLNLGKEPNNEELSQFQRDLPLFDDTENQ
jgi:hypothetical protein